MIRPVDGAGRKIDHVVVVTGIGALLDSSDAVDEVEARAAVVGLARVSHAQQLVAAITAVGQLAVAGARFQPVVAGVAMEGVHAIRATQVVVAVPAEDLVVARASVDGVGARAAAQDIVVGTAVDAVLVVGEP